MGLLILANAFLGLAIALLYYPESPLYLFAGIKLEELWLWSKYQAFIASLLFIFALLSVDTNIKGKELARSLSAFTATLQGLLNIFPAAMYLYFLHGATSAQLTLRGSTIGISSRELAFHLLIMLISWSTATWLVFSAKNKDLAKRSQAFGTKSFIGEGI